MSKLKALAAKKGQEKDAPSYVALLNDHLASTKKPREGYHPSSISYKFCPRQSALIQLKMLTPVQEIDARLQRIFDNGHYVHARFQKWTQEMDLEVDNPIIAERSKVGKSGEVRLYHDVGIRSSCDHVLNLEDGYWDVTDYKSINPDAFKTLLQPIAYHEKQLTVYMGLLQDLFIGEELPAKIRGRMVYECKGTQQMKEFIVPWDAEHQGLYMALISLLEKVNEAVKKEDPDLVPCTCGACPTGGYDKLLENPKKVKV